MGFHVRLDDESQRLVEFVSTDPSKLLGKVYAAYILFLIGVPDEVELKWLLDHAKALDSLTGADIAYAVFAERFNVKLKTDEFNLAPDRPPANVGQASVENINTPRGVRRLVKDGTFGMVVDGDELTAITYGTDRVARELGILDKLPCMVVIDAVPRKDLCVISLDEDITKKLIPLLRKSIAKFSSEKGDKTIRGYAEQIIGMQDLIAQENRRSEELQQGIRAATYKIDSLLAAMKSGAAVDSPHLQSVLHKRVNDRQALCEALERFPEDRTKRISEIDSELESLLREYWRHPDLLFSVIIEKHVRSLGLQSKLSAAKTQTLGYIGALLKPEILLKIWGGIQGQPEH
jgi:hypothetical protein